MDKGGNKGVSSNICPGLVKDIFSLMCLQLLGLPMTDRPPVISWIWPQLLLLLLHYVDDYACWSMFRMLFLPYFYGAEGATGKRGRDRNSWHSSLILWLFTINWMVRRRNHKQLNDFSITYQIVRLIEAIALGNVCVCNDAWQMLLLMRVGGIHWDTRHKDETWYDMTTGVKGGRVVLALNLKIHLCQYNGKCSKAELF